MPPQLLFPIDHLDLTRITIPMEEVRKFNMQRFEMEQIDGIIAMNMEESWIVGVKEVRSDEFWVRGHIPGRPLLPGVLMLESAAQLSTYLVMKKLGYSAAERFIGFAGIDKVRYRGAVVPGDRLILLSKNVEARNRVSVSRCQGLVKDRLIFECEVMGMLM